MNQPGVPKKSGEDAYTYQQWEEDLYAAYALRENPKPCPQCGRTGFFGPRYAEPNIRCRACRFCGYSQEVGNAAKQTVPVVHGCEEWPHVARAPYLWWLPPDREDYDCPFCKEKVQAAETLVRPPSDDESHPWRKVPQGRPYKYYVRFWENWPSTKGRSFF